MAGKYKIVDSSGKHSNFELMRHDERAGIPNNAELQFWLEREAYRKAFEAASRVMWMAEKYAEGGRVEQEDYDAAKEDIKQSLLAHGLQPQERQ